MGFQRDLDLAIYPPVNNISTSGRTNHQSSIPLIFLIPVLLTGKARSETVGGELEFGPSEDELSILNYQLSIPGLFE